MAPSMVTAARLLGHKTVNGKYKSRLQLDESEAFGMQMTHSLDSYITDRYVPLVVFLHEDPIKLTQRIPSPPRPLSSIAP